MDKEKNNEWSIKIGFDCYLYSYENWVSVKKKSEKITALVIQPW